MTKYKKGKKVKGVVTGIEPYGAFVSLDEFYIGLIHISEISSNYVKDIHEFLNIGDNIIAEILDVDENLFRLKLSIKNLKYRDAASYQKHKISETSHGFSTLQYWLPIWTEESKKKYKKAGNTIDN